MKTHNKKILIYCFSLIFLYFSEFSIASEVDQNFNLAEVSEGNYLHSGIHVSIDDKQHDDIANIGFIIGDKCVAVIDTGGSVNIGQKLLDSIRSITEKPICYVINTHIHFDHVLGNHVFLDEKPKYVGHQNLPEVIEQNREFFLKQFSNDLGPNPSKDMIIGPDTLIDGSMTLDLGNRLLVLTSYPVAHTNTDLTVLDKKTGTFWAGDLIFRQRIPSLTGSLKDWLKVIDDLHSIDAKLVIPGHGDVATSIDIALEQEEGYFKRLLIETRKAIAEGEFINDAMETIDKDNKSNWLLFKDRHASNVSKAFTELEWE